MCLRRSDLRGLCKELLFGFGLAMSVEHGPMETIVLFPALWKADRAFCVGVVKIVGLLFIPVRVLVKVDCRMSTFATC